MKNYKRMMNGGMVRGRPGIDNNLVALSKGEAVLPEDTTRAVGPENIRALIAATHKPVKAPPVKAVSDLVPAHVDGYTPMPFGASANGQPIARSPLSDSATTAAPGAAMPFGAFGNGRELPVTRPMSQPTTPQPVPSQSATSSTPSFTSSPVNMSGTDWNRSVEKTKMSASGYPVLEPERPPLVRAAANGMVPAYANGDAPDDEENQRIVTNKPLPLSSYGRGSSVREGTGGLMGRLADAVIRNHAEWATPQINFVRGLVGAEAAPAGVMRTSTKPTPLAATKPARMSGVDDGSDWSRGQATTAPVQQPAQPERIVNTPLQQQATDRGDTAAYDRMMAQYNAMRAQDAQDAQSAYNERTRAMMDNANWAEAWTNKRDAQLGYYSHSGTENTPAARAAREKAFLADSAIRAAETKPEQRNYLGEQQAQQASINKELATNQQMRESAAMAPLSQKSMMLKNTLAQAGVDLASLKQSLMNRAIDPKATEDARTEAVDLYQNLFGAQPRGPHYSMHVVGAGSDEVGRPLPQRLMQQNNRTGEMTDVTPGQKQAAPAKSDWMAAAKKANPKASDAELEAAYQSKYGKA